MALAVLVGKALLTGPGSLYRVQSFVVGFGGLLVFLQKPLKP